MYKDFKKSESLDTGFVGGSGIIWMFSGIILGLLVGLGMYYFSNAQKNDAVGSPQQPITSNTSDAAGNAAATAAPSATATGANGANTANADATQKQAQTAPMENISIVGKDEPNADAAKKKNSKFSYYAVLPTMDVPVGSAKPIDTRNIVAANPEAIKKASMQKQKVDAVEAPTKVRKGNAFLQVASFKRKSRANRALYALSKRGVKARVQKKKIKGRMWYRIVAGPVDQKSAKAWERIAKKLGHKPILTPAH